VLASIGHPPDGGRRVAMSEPTILIQFNPETWTPLMIFYNGATDEETSKLKEIVITMLKALPDREVAPQEEPEP
jgi:hypothetical protein